MARTTDDWMPLRLKIWRSGTAFMMPEARGPYLDLILAYWELGPLPNQDDVLQQIARVADRKLWCRIRDQIIAKFEIIDSKLHHERCDTELALAQQQYERRSSAGKAGGKASVEAKAKQKSSNASADDKAKSNTTYQVPSPDGETLPDGSVARTARRRTPGTRLPADWKPDEQLYAYAAGADYGLLPAETDAEANEFRDYFHGADAREPVKRDWPAAFRRWIRQNARRRLAARAGWAARSARGRQDPAGIISISREILAEMGKQPDGSDAETHSTDPGSGPAECPSDDGECLEADDARGMFEAAHGTADQDRAEEPDCGRRESPDGGLPSRFGSVPGGRSETRADDVAEDLAVVAGVERAPLDAGRVQPREASAAQAFLGTYYRTGETEAEGETPDRGGSPGEDELEIPAFLKRAV
jgi:uncharacterized protein YdaU (DUF1376 family)